MNLSIQSTNTIVGNTHQYMSIITQNPNDNILGKYDWFNLIWTYYSNNDILRYYAEDTFQNHYTYYRGIMLYQNNISKINYVEVRTTTGRRNDKRGFMHNYVDIMKRKY